MSIRTKKCKRASLIFGILSALFMFGPIAYYIVEALFQDGVVFQKCALVASVMVVLIMTAVSLINKKMIRSRIWILLLAVYWATTAFETAIILVAVTQIIDELIISPLHKKYRTLYIINKEADRRGENS